MSNITASTDFDRVKDEDLKKHLNLFGEQVLQVLTNGLDFASNFNGKMLSMTFDAANTDASVQHGLGRVPVGYLVYQRSASMVVYDGSVANTASTLTLRASSAGTTSLIVF